MFIATNNYFLKIIYIIIIPLDTAKSLIFTHLNKKKKAYILMYDSPGFTSNR